MAHSSASPLSLKKARLVELLRQKTAEPAVYPLSLAQRRLWFLSQLVPGSAFYNIPGALRITGDLNIAILEQSVCEAVRRHESLRTRFRDEKGEPVQTVCEDGGLRLELTDLRGGMSASDLGTASDKLVRQEAARGFDLEQGPLLRVRLMWLAEDEYILLLTLHHIVSDGWSQAVLFRELNDLYRAYETGGPSMLEELEIQYGDYALWQQQWLTGESYERQLGYWREQLKALETLQMPTDHARPQMQSFRGAMERLIMEEEVLTGLRGFARKKEATLYMALLAGFVAMLHRYSGQRDIALGTPTANRDRAEIEDLIGFFVNMLVLRVRIHEEMSFDQLLQSVKEVCLGAYGHQSLPFEKLVEDLQPERDLSRNPLFQVVFVQLTPLVAENRLGKTRQSRMLVGSTTTKFDLQVNVEETGGGLEVVAEYSTDLYEANTVKRILRHFASLLNSAVTNPAAPVGRLEVLSASERGQLLEEWNDTEAHYDREACIHELIERQARDRCDAVAIICGEEVMTYEAVNARANQLGHYLRARASAPQPKIGILLNRSPEMVTALLGVLKSGGVYVPLDAAFPPARMREILAPLQVEHLIVHSSFLPVIDELQDGLPSLRDLIILDDIGGFVPPAIDFLKNLAISKRITSLDDLGKQPTENPASLSSADDPAYIIFTSGSTGTPKGVVVHHRPVINLIEWITRTFDIGADDELLFITSLCFDLSVYDVFGILAAGGRIRLATDADVKDPQRLVDLLLHEAVTFWDSAPAALQQITNFLPAAPAQGTANLRLVFLSGDWIPVTLPDRIRNLFGRARIVALGGATEATVWSNFYPVGWIDPAWPSIPYGKPIQNARYYVLDSYLNPCPIGVAGDLYIGGECLFESYANEPVLTASKLTPDPFFDSNGARLYRTGDRARFWVDGVIEFLGRADSQVKLRGYRIELGEIESHLNQYPGVSHSVAIVREVTAGNRQLIACYVADGEPPPLPDELRSVLRNALPEYMVPWRIVRVSDIPLTTNGKVDRNRLTVLVDSLSEEAPVFLEPSTRIEQLLAEIWRAVLGIERISIESNFFELGGNSLSATRVIALVRESFHLNVPLRKLFEYPTISELANEIESALVEEIETLTDAEAEILAEGHA